MKLSTVHGYLVQFSKRRNQVGPFRGILKILQSFVHSRDVSTVLGVAVKLAFLEADERHFRQRPNAYGSRSQQNTDVQAAILSITLFTSFSKLQNFSTLVLVYQRRRYSEKWMKILTMTIHSEVLMRNS